MKFERQGYFGMLAQFTDHISKHGLLKEGDKVLLAVSGGIDSMVMTHLFAQTNWVFGIAHCNFQLRNTDSDLDEAFVAESAEKLNIPFYCKRFDTKETADRKNVSIQVAARDLRYAWFRELMEQHGYTRLATAHHSDDSLETVLLNLVRGTGLDGTQGILEISGTTIRPLIFASRSEIRAYANNRDIRWREDVSNQSNDYSRNLIRNEVLPLLEQINPSLRDTWGKTRERLVAGVAFSRNYVDSVKASYSYYQGEVHGIKCSWAGDHEHPDVLLWEMIKTYGFNFDQCKQIITSLDTTGARFNSGKHELLVNRGDILIRSQPEESRSTTVIDDYHQPSTLRRKSMRFQIVHGTEVVGTDIRSVCLDLDKLQFPLIWRLWKEGDKMVPIGMKGHKKISDMLIDSKLSSFDKEQVTVLESDGEIVWLVGLRMGDHFKVTPETTKVLKASID